MEQYLSAAAEGWEKDGIRLLETEFSPECLLMTFSVRPNVAPTLFTARVKGRLQHSLAGAGLRVKFSRKVAMRLIGENHREEVEAYIASQIANESWCDPRIMEVLAPFTVTNPDADCPRRPRQRAAVIGTMCISYWLRKGDGDAAKSLG